MGEIGRPSPHKTTHQDTGTDEIVVTGLSGLLGDSQTPLAHKTSHQDGGSDKINITGLTRSPVFVNRGDAPAYDFQIGSFITDGLPHDLDLSPIVPTGAIAVLLAVALNDDLLGTYIQLNLPGETGGYNVSILKIYVALASIWADMICPLSTDRKINYTTSNTTISALNMTVRGWWI